MDDEGRRMKHRWGEGKERIFRVSAILHSFKWSWTSLGFVSLWMLPILLTHPTSVNVLLHQSNHSAISPLKQANNSLIPNCTSSSTICARYSCLSITREGESFLEKPRSVFGGWLSRENVWVSVHTGGLSRATFATAIWREYPYPSLPEKHKRGPIWRSQSQQRISRLTIFQWAISCQRGRGPTIPFPATLGLGFGFIYIYIYI